MWSIDMRHLQSLWNARFKAKNLVEDPNIPYAGVDASVPLTEEGKAEGKLLKEFALTLFDMYPQAGPIQVTSSTKMRARQSADYVVAAIKKAGIELVASNQIEDKNYDISHLLNERSYGLWSNKTKKEVEDMYEKKAIMAVKIASAASIVMDHVELSDEDKLAIYNDAKKELTDFVMQQEDEFSCGFDSKAPGGESLLDVANRLEIYNHIRQFDANNDKRYWDISHGNVWQIKTLILMKQDPYNYKKLGNPGNGALRLVTDDGKGGYIDHGYIYDPSRNIDITKKKRSKLLETFFH